MADTTRTLLVSAFIKLSYQSLGNIRRTVAKATEGHVGVICFVAPPASRIACTRLWCRRCVH
jgi:hypothetical protein